MKNRIILIVVLIAISVCFYYLKNLTENEKPDTENIYVPINYTLDNYVVVEVSNISCSKSSQCSTPGEYLIRSSCPYTSLCINNKCNVVCPQHKEPIIGADRDIHGCIGSAGYSWCQEKNKCLRIWEEKCDSIVVSTSPTATTNIESLCKQKYGVYYPAEKLCEVNLLSKAQCLAQEGQFNECASACRHDFKAQICTMQCVLTCTFK